MQVSNRLVIGGSKAHALHHSLNKSAKSIPEIFVPWATEKGRAEIGQANEAFKARYPHNTDGWEKLVPEHDYEHQTKDSNYRVPRDKMDSRLMNPYHPKTWCFMLNNKYKARWQKLPTKEVPNPYDPDCYPNEKWPREGYTIRTYFSHSFRHHQDMMSEQQRIGRNMMLFIIAIWTYMIGRNACGIYMANYLKYNDVYAHTFTHEEKEMQRLRNAAEMY